MNLPENKNRRLVSGKRVICYSSMILPKVNQFSSVKALRDGPLVFNVRGCSLYCLPQYNPNTIREVFKSDEPGVIKEFRLFPPGSKPINLQNVTARFVRFTNTQKHVGMVLRFVNLNETQLDTLFALTDSLPEVSTNEEQQISDIFSQSKM